MDTPRWNKPSQKNDAHLYSSVSGSLSNFVKFFPLVVIRGVIKMNQCIRCQQHYFCKMKLRRLIVKYFAVKKKIMLLRYLMPYCTKAVNLSKQCHYLENVYLELELCRGRRMKEIEQRAHVLITPTCQHKLLHHSYNAHTSHSNG